MEEGLEIALFDSIELQLEAFGDDSLIMHRQLGALCVLLGRAPPPRPLSFNEAKLQKLEQKRKAELAEDEQLRQSLARWLQTGSLSGRTSS